MIDILSRYHLVSMFGIVVLGVAGNYALPQLAVAVPWTVFLLVITAAISSSVFAFAGMARYSSPTLAAENIRLSRFPEPIRFASDGRMLWAGVPCKGWKYLKTWITSGGNPGIAIVPAAMLEQESDAYTIARCKLYHLTPQAVRVLARKRTFNRLLTDLGYEADSEKKVEVFFGMHSTTLHPDHTHIQSPTDLSEYAKSLSTDEREYIRVSNELANQMVKTLGLWRMVQGSSGAKTATQRREEDQ